MLQSAIMDAVQFAQAKGISLPGELKEMPKIGKDVWIKSDG